MAKQSQNSPLILMKGVHKAYPVGEGQFIALKDINLEIAKGEFLGVTGKSGAGKTTLLNMITGVSELTSGEVLFYDNENGNQLDKSAISIHSLDEDQMAIWRGKNLGIVYQSFELIPSLSLIENIMFPPDFLGTYHPITSKEKALHLLEEVGIVEHAYKIPAHISGGQMQRVAIARALVNDPSLIVADEPTGNLDSVTAETIFQLFEKLVARGKTIIMVTHDDSLAPRFSKRYHIIDGEIEYISKNGKPKTKTALVVEEDQEDQPTAKQTGSPRKKPASSAKKQKDHLAIIMRKVDKVYENAAGKFIALKSIDLQLNYGQFISIVGKSGSGKSTLINMITGIDHPTAGEIIVGNENIYEMTESERSLWRGRNMGVVFQFFQLLPTLTLLENTILPMDFCDVYPYQERPQRAMELLRKVGLEEQADKLPGSVSSGQQQSAAIARSLATDPSIILADEPTGNLDSRSAEVILSLFEELAGEGKTIIIVTHDPSITKRTDQTIILSDGEIIDQTIARALPSLSHPQMLAATHKAKKQTYAPNEIILRQGDPVENFFMIVEGEVEIILANDTDKEISLAQLGPGQFFGEVELTHNQNSIASVQASKNGAKLASLPREEFFKLIDDSPLTRNTLQEIAKTRLAENKRRRETDK